MKAPLALRRGALEFASGPLGFGAGDISGAFRLLSKGHHDYMLVKQYFSEIILALTLTCMAFYPPTAGVFLFALALTALVSLKFIDSLHTRHDEKYSTAQQAQIDKLKADVERILLRRGGS